MSSFRLGKYEYYCEIVFAPLRHSHSFTEIQKLKCVQLPSVFSVRTLTILQGAHFVPTEGVQPRCGDGPSFAFSFPYLCACMCWFIGLQKALLPIVFSLVSLLKAFLVSFAHCYSCPRAHAQSGFLYLFPLAPIFCSSNIFRVSQAASSLPARLSPAQPQLLLIVSAPEMPPVPGLAL